MGNLGRGRISALLLALLLAGCGELTPPGERAADSSGATSSYTVHRGDTLYSISWGAGLDVRTVAAWNNISPPYTIYPGQQISLMAPHWAVPKAEPSPRHDHTTAKNSHSGRTASSPNYRGKYPTKSTSKSNIEKSLQIPQNLTTSWRWPTQGKVVERFDVAGGKKGIDIGGRRGQEIYAAAAGYVVYSGNGLLGYGNLVIIKHDDTYLSAYGHNSQLLVKEGDRVTAGQQIARMGVSPKDGAILHFEIRREGKPVDPLAYLPKKN